MVLSGFSSISDQELRDSLPAVMRKDKLLDLDFLIKKSFFELHCHLSVINISASMF